MAVGLYVSIHLPEAVLENTMASGKEHSHQIIFIFITTLSKP
jgi:hypothetical protein